MERTLEPQQWQLTLRLWGIEQQQFAQRCGYTPEHLCRLFRGQRTLTDVARARLADGLRVALVEAQPAKAA